MGNEAPSAVISPEISGLRSQRVEPPSRRYGVPRDNAFHLGIEDGAARQSSDTREAPTRRALIAAMKNLAGFDRGFRFRQ